MEHDRVVDLEARVARIGVGRPLEVPQRAAVGAVVAAVVCAGRERLARAVGDEERDAARPRVGEGRPEAGAQVVLGREVHDRVVHEDGVEGPAEPERPHVAEDVLAARVERAAEASICGERSESVHVNRSLQVGGVVAAARAELQQRRGLGQLLEDRVPVPRRLPA